MPYDDLYEYQKQGDDTIYKFLASSLKENNDILPEIEDKQPYLYRATSMPDGSILYVREKLIGASAAVNQLAKNGNFVNTDYWSAGRGIRTVSNNVLTLTADGTALFTQIYQDINIPINHKVLVRYTYDFSSSANIERTNLTYTNGTDYLNAGYSASNKGVNEFIFNPTLNVTRMQFVFTNTHSVSLTASDSGTFKNIQVIDLTQMFGTAIADLAYSKEQASAGSGIAWLKSYGFFTKEYYPYNTGALQSVKTGSKKVVGFNQWDEEWESGVWKTYSGGDGGKQDNENYVRSKNMIPVLPNTQYYFVRTVAASDNRFGYYDKDGNYLGFDAGFGLGSALSILVTTPANAAYITFYFKGDSSVLEGICWNISDESKNGTYEPYTSTTYPLDSNLELRGLYKLDSNNNIVCDGDEYTPDGSVKRRYGIVDLGSLDWINQVSSTSRKYWRAIDSSIKSISNNTIPSIICSKPYNIVTAIAAYNDNTSSSLITSGDSHNVEIYDETYASSTSDQFKAAMSGVYLIYELATETTDSADSYQNPQIIHENGTEEFIDTRDYPLPVGHDTEYFTASDEKFFLPPIVDNDGRFLYHDGDGFQFKNFNQVASKVEESDINGNIKIDGTETQVYDDSELQGIVDTDTTVATGNPLNFSTKSAQNAVNTDIVIDPVQDLHGYSKPWVGGAGKNLWGYGVTGGGFGNAKKLSNDIIANFTVSAKKSISKQLNVCAYDENGTKIGVDYKLIDAGQTSGSYTYTNIDKVVYIIIYIVSGASGDEQYFYDIQIEKGTSTTFYEPYENICPISERTQIGILGWGKNLMNTFVPQTNVPTTITENKGTYSISPAMQGQGGGGAYINYKVTKNKTYTLSFNVVSGSIVNIRLYKYTTSATQGEQIQSLDTSGGTFTALNDGYIRFWISEGTTLVINNVQLEENDQQTPYSPYTESNPYTDLQIPLPNDFYGGTLNLESGELRVEKKLITNISFVTPTTKDANNRWHVAALFGAATDILKSLFGKHWDVTTDYDFICDKIEKKLESECVEGDLTFSVYGHSQYVEFRVRIPSDKYTAAEAQTFAKSCTFIYYIDPYTLHLTPHQLNLLKATNNISTDAKTISVTYRNGELSTYAPATDIADGLLTATDKRAIDRTSDIVEGNPIQFSTESKQIARSTIIDLEPIQDLHGYDKPWVGGAGKNLIDMTEWTDVSGVTHTVVGNKITISATNKKYACSNIGGNNDLKFAPGTYYVKGKCSSISTATGFIRFALRDSANSIKDFVNITTGNVSGSMTISENCYFSILVTGATEASNTVVVEDIILSTVDVPFEPYENICPISGYDEVDINGCGENLWSDGDESFTLNKTIQLDKPLEVGKYTFSALVTSSDTNQSTCRVNFVDVDNTEIAAAYIGRNARASVTVNLVKECTSIVLYASTQYSYSVDDTALFKDIQLEQGEQATPYTPYTESNNISIQLDDTVYGGKLDVEKGELVVTHNIFDIGDINWTYDSTYTRFASQSFSNIKHSTVARIIPIYSTCYESIDDGRSVGEVPNGGIYVGAGSTVEASIYINDYRYTSASDFTTGLAGQKVCYELASPFTIKLTPHQINLLKGVNTITTNADSITLQYRNGEVATLEDLKILSDNLIAHTEDTEPYGFIEHMSILDPAQRIEYIGKNKNYSPMTINLAGDHLANYNEWYDFPVIKENKPYMIKADGTVDYALDPNDYTKKFDGSASDVANTSYTGGAFAWIPKTYKREFTVGDDRYVYISTKKLSDEYEAIGFIDENGLEHDGAWIPMFYGTEITQDGTVKIMSLATGTPSQSRDTTTQKTYIENFSSQAKFFGGPIVNVLADLLIMLGKNSDIQAVFGTGNMSGGNGTQYMKANACLNGGAFYGSSTNTALNKAFHSLVLLTQNSYQRDPYTILVNGTLKVSPYYKYDITGATYQDTGITYPATSSAWEYPHKSISVPHWGAVPDKGPYSGSTTTGWADGFYKNVSSTRVGFRFAACTNGRVGDPRCLDLGGAASYASWHIGASALLFSEGKSK